MAGTLRRALHPQRSRLILSAWPVLSTCFRKIMWPTNTFSFGIAKRLRKLRLGRSNSPARQHHTAPARLARKRHRAYPRSSFPVLAALTVILIWLGVCPALLVAIRAAALDRHCGAPSTRIAVSALRGIGLKEPLRIEQDGGAIGAALKAPPGNACARNSRAPIPKNHPVTPWLGVSFKGDILGLDKTECII